jgi:protein-L-isoaspartate O-methyltransferase
MVIPVGGRNCQRLLRIRRDSSGFTEEALIECNFVALVGEYGWEKRGKGPEYY